MFDVKAGRDGSEEGLDQGSSLSQQTQARLQKPTTVFKKTPFPDFTTDKKYYHSFMKQPTDRGGKITKIVFVKEPQTPSKIIFLFMVKKRSDYKYEKIFKEIRAESGLDPNSKICHKNLNNNHILFPFVASEMCSVIILNSSNVNNRLGEFGCFSL